jgi:hypothetical protein
MNVENFEVLSIKVTTHKPRNEYDIPIHYWKYANLRQPSFARVSQSIIIPKTSFLAFFGNILDTIVLISNTIRKIF